MLKSITFKNLFYFFKKVYNLYSNSGIGNDDKNNLKFSLINKIKCWLGPLQCVLKCHVIIKELTSTKFYALIINNLNEVSSKTNVDYDVPSIIED